MKKLLILSAMIGSFSMVQAQSKNDPTYSIHNYKQPNKAAEAPSIKKEGVDNESYINEQNVANRNYKASGRTLDNSGAAMVSVPVESKTNALASTGNYKSAFGKNNSSTKAKEQDIDNNPVVKSKDQKNKNQ